MHINNVMLRIEEILRSHSKSILNSNNIVGLARGVKIINNKWTNIPCITIFVNEKRLLKDLNYYEVIPPAVHGIYTDVITKVTDKINPKRIRFASFCPIIPTLQYFNVELLKPI